MENKQLQYTWYISQLFVSIIVSLLYYCINPNINTIACNTQEDIDLHDYEEVNNETDIKTKECAAYAIQKKVDLESNPAYIYAQIGDQAITVEMKECVAYGTQDTVTTEAN